MPIAPLVRCETPRRLLTALLLVCLDACAASLPPPETPPAVTPRQDALPPLGEARLTLRLSLPIDGVDALVRQSIALPQAKDFQRVTGPGDNPEVEARYASVLEGLHWSSGEDRLRLRADVAYHATLRARARTPFGRIWLTKGSDWGTAKRPGRMELRLASRLRVTKDWTLSANTSLTGVKLRAPEAGKVCTSGAFRLCIDGRMVEREIHGRLESTVRTQIEPELSALDRELSRQVPLRQAAETLWAGLVDATAKVGLVPEALAVDTPRVREDQLTLDLRLRASASRPGQGAAGALPAAQARLEGDDVLPLQWHLDWQALAARLSTSLPRALGDGGWSLVGVEVRGAEARAGRYWLTLLLREGEREASVHLSARLSTRGSAVRASAFEWSDVSAAWLESVGLLRPLEAQLGALRGDMVEPMGGERARVGRALGAAAGLMPLELTDLDAFSLNGIYADANGVWLQGTAR